MEAKDFDAQVAAARSAISDPERSHKVGIMAGDIPRFELYHAWMSLCSQKVRSVMAQKHVAYTAHDMVIMCGHDAGGRIIPAENYHPDYVRLRTRGNAALNHKLVSSYTGQSSVTTEGFDPCVVPTLIDHEKRAIIVDSLVICRYIDEQVAPANSLVPTDPAIAERMAWQLEIIDTTPHPALLYGFHPEEDYRPAQLKYAMQTVYDDKVEALEALIDLNREDTALVEAYKAKIAKESGGKIVSRDVSFQRNARTRLREVLIQLESDLQEAVGGWICGDTFTLADLSGGVSLFRLSYLGLSRMWDDLPEVKAYFNRLRTVPALREQSIQSTARGMPHSEYAAELETE